MLEFAIIAPVFILLISAVVQFGFACAAYIALKNGAATGARYCAMYTNEAATIRQVVYDAAKPTLKFDNLNAACTVKWLEAYRDREGTLHDPGPQATVVVATYNLPLNFPFSAIIGSGGSLQLRSESMTQ